MEVVSAKDSWPCVVMGDFNAICYGIEKISGKPFDNAFSNDL